MNYKLEKFWNLKFPERTFESSLWTINLKSFEINSKDAATYFGGAMNYKLEKFWNTSSPSWSDSK